MKGSGAFGHARAIVLCLVIFAGTVVTSAEPAASTAGRSAQTPFRARHPLPGGGTPGIQGAGQLTLRGRMADRGDHGGRLQTTLSVKHLDSATTGRVWDEVNSGLAHTCGLRLDHTLWCWGDNEHGELGQGDYAQRNLPAQVGSDTDWVIVKAGQDFTCGIRKDGTLWCWGWNNTGQLGLGDTVDRDIPTQVGHDSNRATVRVGAHDTGPMGAHACAIRVDSTLWCWGLNNFGQLGLGDEANRYVPTQVGSDADWLHLAAAYSHTCAIRLDHTLWCWGENRYGQLGLGDAGRGTERLIPTWVGGFADWDSVRGGNSYTCGTRLDHTVWCWGIGGYELGLGDRHKRTVPTQVGAQSNWANVSTGAGHTCGVRLDHGLWCWGYNSSGQLGVGDRHPRKVPTQIGAALNWNQASAGSLHTCGTRRSHTLWCWGNNDFGQLGLGDYADRSTPTQV